MPFLAIVNTPGYLPEVEPSGPFDTAREAWEILVELRDIDEQSTDPDWEPDNYSEGSQFLQGLADKGVQAGTFILKTPNYTGDHDLGQAYCVVEVLAGGTVKA